MTIRNKIAAIGLLAFIFIIGVSCEKNDSSNSDENNSDFNRKALLENTANNIIIPNYQKLSDQLNTLQQKTDAFTSSPGTATLDEAQQAFRDAYVAWQHCSTFEFGPAKEKVLRKNTNSFPTDDATISENIASGNYDFSAYNTKDEKGFPALDYLLFGRSDDAAIIDSFTSGPHASNRKTYLKDVVQRLKSDVESVLNDWQPSGGNYVEEFVNNTGTGQGSSLSLLVNEVSFDWEIIKDEEFGIPAGLKSINQKFPEKVQAFYSDYSIKLSVEHVKAIENIFLGQARSGADGKGLDEYLQSLDAQKGNEPLAKKIRQQFGTCKQKIQAISSPLSASINNEEAKVEGAFNAVLKNLALIKTDMASALGVQITYQDNDGD